MTTMELFDLLEKITKDPENSQQTIKTIVAEYKPAIYAIADELYDIAKELSDKKWYQLEADNYRKLYDALSRNMFTREEVMNILLTKVSKSTPILEAMAKNTK